METTYSIKNFAMRIATAVVLLCVIGIGNVWGAKITDYSDIVSGKTYYIGATTSTTDYYLSVDGSTLSASIAGTAVTSKASATQFVFTGSGTSWTIKFADGSYYLGLKNSKDNGKVQVVASACTFIAGNRGDLICLTESTASYAIEKNTTTTNFGSYGKTMTDIWLEEVSSTYTVTYSDNDATSGTAPTDNTAYSSSNNTVTVLGNTGNLSKTGFVFSGWNTEANGSGTTYSPSGTFTISTDITLYAYWLGARYNLLTDLDNLEEDDEIIIVNTGVSHALSTEQGTNNRGASNYLITNQDKTTVTLTGSSVQSLTVGKVGDDWTFYTGDGYLCAPGSGGNNYLKTAANSSENNSHWEIVINGDNEASITAQGGGNNVMQYNNGNTIFSCYGTASQTALKIYYKKARQLTFYRTKCYREFSPAGASGNWSTEANWTNNRLPNINDLARIKKPVTVDMEVPTAAKAKNVVIYNDGSTHTGQLIIDAGKELVVAETVRKTTDGSNYTATGENDIVINSTSGAGLGALAIGSHATANGLNNATVNFTTKSNGSTTSQSTANASDAQYVGTPFSNKPAMLYQFYNSWMFKFVNTGTPGWVKLNGGEGLEAFKGYCVFSADGTNHTYWMQGTLVASETQVIEDLYYSGSGDASDPNHENMLANSWMAPIKIAAFDASVGGDFTDADATIYIYNTGSPDDYTTNGGSTGDLTGQYKTYTPGTAGSAIIPSMQAFSVYTKGGNPVITLNYKRLVYDPAVAGSVAPGPNKAPQRAGASEDEADKMRLFVRAENGYGDMLYMWEREDFEEGFENGWDGRKIFGADVAPQLYAVTTDGNMAINCVPDWEGTVLGFKKGTEDNVYTFTFEYEGENTWYLNDLREQTSTLISSESRYMFMASDEDMAARFIISATPISYVPTAIENGEAEATIVRKLLIDGHVYIIRNGRMYDATGVMVK